jgi:hypothetical protein
MEEKKLRQEKSVLGSLGSSFTGYPSSSISGGSFLGGLGPSCDDDTGAFSVARSKGGTLRRSFIGGGAASPSLSLLVIGSDSVA